MNKKILVTFFLLIPFFTVAHEHSDKNMAETIVVDAAWARETFKMAQTGAAYLRLNNPSEKAIELLAVSVDDETAQMVEIHNTVVEDNMMRMKHLEDGVVIAAGETLSFQPGGMHLMLMGLKGPLVANETFELVLHFADESTLSKKVVVRDMRTITE